MSKKIALQGFSRVQFFPVIKNDASGYETDEGFDMPWAQEMTKDADVSETKVYGDDVLYLNMKSWNGLNSSITLIEITLAMMEKLGFGTLDAETGVFKWNPQGQNKQFAVTFRCKRADGNYRMYKMFSFTVNEIKESGIKTLGEGNTINSYQLIGTFTARLKDDLPGEIKDSESAADLTWLDTVEKVA